MVSGAFCLSLANTLERICALKPDCLSPLVNGMLESHRACATDLDAVKLVQVALVHVA